jgi:hypothetical protein
VGLERSLAAPSSFSVALDCADRTFCILHGRGSETPSRGASRNRGYPNCPRLGELGGGSLSAEHSLPRIDCHPPYSWPRLDRGNLDLVEWHLRSAKSLRPDFSFVGLYDLDGRMRVIYPPQPALLGQEFANRDWYKGVAERWEPQISEVYQSAVPPHELVVAIAVPVTDAQGKPIAILMGADALDTISQRLGTQLEGGWTIQLVDHSARAVARHGSDSGVPVDLSLYQPVHRVQAGQSGSGSFRRGSEAIFAGYEPAGKSGWGVVVEQPSVLLERSVGLMERRIWFLGFVFLLAGLSLSTFMGSLYARLETGNRFLDLSVDMFCILGIRWILQKPKPKLGKSAGFYHGRANGEAPRRIHTP